MSIEITIVVSRSLILVVETQRNRSRIDGTGLHDKNWPGAGLRSVTRLYSSQALTLVFRDGVSHGYLFF